MPDKKIDFDVARTLAKYTRRYPRIHSSQQFQLASAFLALQEKQKVAARAKTIKGWAVVEAGNITGVYLDPSEAEANMGEGSIISVSIVF